MVKIPMLRYVAGTARAWSDFVSLPATRSCRNELCFWIISQCYFTAMRQGKGENKYENYMDDRTSGTFDLKAEKGLGCKGCQK